MSSLPHTPSEPLHDIEFRTADNDAWYTARTLLDNRKNLVVKFLHFDDDQDVVIRPNQFRTVQEVEELEKRFRPVSRQLQDKECRSLAKGVLLCASHSFNEYDVRFYDAILEDVIVKKHHLDKTEEECTCDFVVVWQHGPFTENMAIKRVENICVVQPNPRLDPKAAAFFMDVRKKLQSAYHMPIQIINDGGSSSDAVTRTNSSSSTKDDWTFRQSSSKRIKLARSPIEMQSSREKISGCTQRIGEDTDIGGDKRCYLILIENLDKDLSFSSIVEFVHKETSISVEACVFPSLPWMLYCCGVISVDCQRNLEKLYKLFDSSDRIVVSGRGRPCVVSEMLSQYDLAASPILASMLKYQDETLHGNLKINNCLKVVYSSSEEYKTAVQLKGIFLEFLAHQRRLQKGLEMEENKVQWPSLPISPFLAAIEDQKNT